jgi:hypothetical protein
LLLLVTQLKIQDSSTAAANFRLEHSRKRGQSYSRDGYRKIRKAAPGLAITNMNKPTPTDRMVWLRTKSETFSSWLKHLAGDFVQ